MIYAVSNLHGEHNLFKQLLQKINFSEHDTLYVLGDIVDKGPASMELLLDMMTYPNIIPLLGNHDLEAGALLPLLSKEPLTNLKGHAFVLAATWELKNGGSSTLEGFQALSEEDRKRVLSYIDRFEFYAEVSAGGNEYVLTHAGIQNYAPDRPLSDYMVDDLIRGVTNYDEPVFYGNKYLVTGHIPTHWILANPRPGFIYRTNNHIAIHCGVNFAGGRLGAICLDTGEEFYVEYERG